MTVAHATVASDPQSPLLGATDWNDDHIVLLDANDVGADPAGSAATALSDANDYTDAAVAALTVRTAAGVPAGAPAGSELPLAFDSTPLTGGLYVWTGAAWVLVATIAPTLAAFS